MKISFRSKNIKPSLTRELFNKALDYDDVIDLTLGDPDFNTPERIKNAACNAILDNKTHYTVNAGVIDARRSISNHVKENWGVSFDAVKNIIMTVGGMEALFLALLCTVDPEDEVIIFSPYYVNYIQMTQLCGGVPVVINSYNAECGINIDFELLENKINEKTTVIILNSPNNPTGAVIDEKTLKKIAVLAEKYDLTIISDEVYRTLLYDGKKHNSILQFDEAKSRTVLIDSLSKEFSMTGWRVGYACGPEDLIAAMIKCQENVAACVTVPSQYALIEAYNGYNNDFAMRTEFQSRRDFICNSINEMPGLKCRTPDGTFYVFVNIENTKMDSVTFAYELLEKERVAVVPGVAYGSEYDSYIRIAFTKDISVLNEAMVRMGRFLNSLDWENN